MKYTFQHFLDISTSADTLTMLQIQAGGQYTLDRIKHLFPAYKYIKLGRVSVKFLPASTLPVDPLGLSYDSSDAQTIDPRDQMNPGLVRITNGENIVTDFTDMSDEVMEQMYINTMLDPRWSKFMLQSGFKRSAVPLYWNVGQLAQDPYPGAVVNIPGMPDSGLATTTTAIQHYDANYLASDAANSTSPGVWNRGYSDPRGFFQTGHRGRMGWMPTDAFYQSVDRTLLAEATLEDAVFNQAMIMPIPEVQCITVLLPKAYKTIYYYRMFITETVYLSGLKNTGINTDERIEYAAIDNFIRAQDILPLKPSTPSSIQATVPDPLNTGGGEE